MQNEMAAERSLEVAKKYSKESSGTGLTVEAIFHDLCDRGGFKSIIREMEKESIEDMKNVWAIIINKSGGGK